MRLDSMIVRPAVAAALLLAALAAARQESVHTPLGTPAQETINPPTSPERAALERDIQLLTEAAKRPVACPERAPTVRDAIESLARASGMPIEVSWEALKEQGITDTDATTFKTGPTNLAAALEALCFSLGEASGRLRLEAFQGKLWLTSEAQTARMRQVRVYSLDHLEPEATIELVTESIDPEGWIAAGGDRATARVMDEAMIVQAPASTHRRLAWFLDELRSKIPAAVDVSAELLLAPAGEVRTILEQNLEPDAAAKSMRGILSSIPLASPRIVSRVGAEAVAEVSAAPRSFRLGIAAGRVEDSGLVLRYSVTGNVDGATASLTGELPVSSVPGRPQILVSGLPDGGDRVLVVILRVRPIAVLAGNR